METDPLFLPVFAVLKDGVIEQIERRNDAVAIGVTSGGALGLGQRFQFVVPPGETRTIVLRVAAVSFTTLAADIVDLPSYIQWASVKHVIVLFALAIILAIGVYNLSLGIALRRVSHIWYALHALSGFIAWALVYGIFADLFGFSDHDRIAYKLAIAGVVTFQSALCPVTFCTRQHAQGAGSFPACHRYNPRRFRLSHNPALAFPRMAARMGEGAGLRLSRRDRGQRGDAVCWNMGGVAPYRRRRMVSARMGALYGIHNLRHS
jgi:7TM diverse intracellular signalling.